MHKHTDIWEYLQKCSSRRVSRKLVVGIVFSFVCLGLTFATNVSGAHAQARACATGDRSYRVVGGDTLSAIASRSGTTWSNLASYNHISNPDLIYVDQTICIPGNGSHVAPPPPKTGGAGSAPVATPPAAPGNNGSVVAMINQVFGANAPAAIRIATCESGLNPNAYNAISIGGSHAAGLFQILYPSTWYGTSQASASPYNAYANIVAAHEIFVRDGYSWREWVCQ